MLIVGNSYDTKFLFYFTEQGSIDLQLHWSRVQDRRKVSSAYHQTRHIHTPCQFVLHLAKYVELMTAAL